jgi:N-acetylglutamate synthase-like GNAT family acetyltransferase
MPVSSFGAKPTVLRCSRCGKFVDWEDARLQIVCGCRPHLDLPPVLVRDATAADRPAMLALFARDFGRTGLVTFGDAVDLEAMPAVVADSEGELAGALAYRERQDALHIIALATDPIWQRSGVGGHLVADAERIAREKNLSRVIVATTNDNLPSLYFYQRRGYCITQVLTNTMAGAKGRPPVIGFGGIAVRDEIHLTKPLTVSGG